MQRMSKRALRARTDWQVYLSGDTKEALNMKYISRSDWYIEEDEVLIDEEAGEAVGTVVADAYYMQKFWTFLWLIVKLYALIMSHTYFRVKLRSIVAWMSRNFFLLETGAISEF